MEHRIHIVGASGTGKTTLGLRLAKLLEIPVFHLDEVARVGGGPGALRTDAERASAIASILAHEAWIVEGVHLGWTDRLLERSTLIVWLDDIPGSLARKRITRRFLREAIAETRRRKGRERIMRFRDYARQIRGLLASVRGGQEGTRAAAASTLERYSERLMVISGDDDIEQLVHRLSQPDSTGRPPVGSP